MKKKLIATALITLCTGFVITSAAFIYDDTIPESCSFFSMDTVVTVKQLGGDMERTTSVIKACSSSLDMYSGKLEKFNCETYSDDTYIYLCTEDTLSLNERYGNHVDITSGALTSLWGVGSDAPRVPSDDEIAKALETIGSDKLSLDVTDIRKPVETKLDFGAVAKGYACDAAADALDYEKTEYAVVSFGSSSLLYGKKPDGSRFSVELRNPDGTDTPLGNLKTKACFISTSGGYERFFEADGKKYCHILDLSTGYPVETDLVSVTVITYSEGGGIKSDFLSTSIFIGGTKELDAHLNARGYKVIAVDVNGKVYVSDGLDFTLNNDSGYSLCS